MSVAYISKPSSSPPLQKIIHIKDMSIFIHKYVGRIIDVKSDSKRNYRTISALLGSRKENHSLIQNLIK